MHTREKHTNSGSFVKLSYQLTELFESVKRESSLRAKHMRGEDGSVNIIDNIITDDEKVSFDKSIEDISRNVSSVLKGFGLDRNDITPEYAKEFYHYKQINDTEKIGFIETVSSVQSLVFYIKDSVSAGHNILSLVDGYMKEYITCEIARMITENMNPEISTYFTEKSKAKFKLLSNHLFYMI